MPWPTSELAVEVRVGCEFQFESAAGAPSVFQVQPYCGAGTRVHHEAWFIEPAVPAAEYRDAFGNRCKRLTIPEGVFVVRYDAAVDVEDDPDPEVPDAAQVAFDRLPPESLQFTLPSRYCLPDIMAGAATDLFGHMEPGWGQVQAVCDWVHNHVAYTMGASTPLTDAADVYMSRQGVCRDFAHVAITFCRALNYPARYAFGYLPLVGRPLPEEGMDFAAWVEVFLGGEWYTFDPRNNARRTGRVLVGQGRDAVDCAMVTSAGTTRLTALTVWAEA